MTNQWVCMTSSSEHSFVRDLGLISERKPPLLIILIAEMMAAQAGKGMVDDDITRISQLGECLLKWIHAYAHCPGNRRACWLGEKKKLVCMTWRDADTSDEDEDDEGDYEEEDDEEE